MKEWLRRLALTAPRLARLDTLDAIVRELDLSCCTATGLACHAEHDKQRVSKEDCDVREWNVYRASVVEVDNQRGEWSLFENLFDLGFRHAQLRRGGKSSRSMRSMLIRATTSYEASRLRRCRV